MCENRLWTTQEIRLLKELREVDKLEWKEIALELDRSYHGVYHKYHKIKKRAKSDNVFISSWLR